jgi:hypothetical protein
MEKRVSSVVRHVTTISENGQLGSGVGTKRSSANVPFGETVIDPVNAAGGAAV